MNRVEYMEKLASLLQDIPEEERREAMQYYNDYFDEAGPGELDSPEKVAAAIKADLYGSAGDAGEYRETGYTDTRFEQKDSPAERVEYSQNKNVPWTNKWLKIFLIIAIIIVGLPIAFGVTAPVILAVLAAVFAIVLSGFVLLASAVIAAVAVMIAGIVIFIAGLIQIPVSVPVTLALVGGGMFLFALGMVGTVLFVKLCMIVFPMMFRGIVNLCRKLVHRNKNGKAVS